MNKYYFNQFAKYLPYLILFFGATIRFWRFWDWSLTNDELSTLIRSQYSTITEVVQKGVIPDVHPIFLEGFMHYWLTLFGDSVFAFRLPAVVASVMALYFFYKFAQALFNQKAATISLSIISTSYLFVTYSQIARAYSFGLLFTMAFTYFSIKVISKKSQLKDQIAMVIFGALGLITHYFTALTIFIIAISLLFYASKKHRKKFFILCISIAILYTPHLPITLSHLSKGGLGWLPTPSSGFIFQHLAYTFNSSTVWQITISLIPFIGMAQAYRFNKIYKRQLIVLLVFLLTYLTGYFYSVFRTPVIQFSTLIFSTPFLILFICSFITTKVNRYIYTIILTFITITGAFSLIIKKDFYDTKKFSNFRDVSKTIIDWKGRYGNNLISFSNANNTAYFDYYIKKSSTDVDFEIARFSSTEEIAKARDIIKLAKEEYISISFGNIAVPTEVYEFAKQKFPKTVKQNRYFNSEAILLSKAEINRKLIFETHALKINSNEWNYNKDNLTDSSFYSSPKAYHLKRNDEYPFSYDSKVGRISSEKNRWINIELYFKSPDTCNLTLVVDVKRDGESIYWRGYETKAFYKKGEWPHFMTVWERPTFVHDEDDISIFIWNLNQVNCTLDDISIRNFADSDYNYY
ncbi:MAG: glycosyltransferase family 39 protein [Vicingaceae bacterium]